MDYESTTGSPIVNIKVLGVGGGGGNAINRMIASNLSGVRFISINTDKQHLLINKAEDRLQIGVKLTKGQGAGNDPSIGEKAAEESRANIIELLQDTDLLFITAGMGGGTGTGAAPVVASIAREMGILTVAVVTKPFEYEGRVRMNNAERGIANLRKFVDTIIIVPNEKLLTVLPKGTPALQAFMYADNILRQGIQGISDIITKPNTINLDFADVRKVIKNKGRAHMGIGCASGDNKVIEAVKQAVSSPMLETSIEGAKSIIVNIVGGIDMGIDDISLASNLIRGVVSPDCEIISGSNIDENLKDTIEITVIATGLYESPEEVEKYNSLQEEIAKEVNVANTKPSDNTMSQIDNMREPNVNSASNVKSVFNDFEDEFKEEIGTNSKVKDAKNEGVQVNKTTSRIELDDDDIPPFLKKLRQQK